MIAVDKVEQTGAGHGVTTSFRCRILAVVSVAPFGFDSQLINHK